MCRTPRAVAARARALDALPRPQAAAMDAALALGSAGVADRFAVYAGTLGLLAAAGEDAPVLCVVDDAHWLDALSADALLFAARRLAAERVAILFAARTGDRPFPATHVPELELGPLDEAAARALVAAGPAPVPDLAARRCCAWPEGTRSRCWSFRERSPPASSSRPGRLRAGARVAGAGGGVRRSRARALGRGASRARRRRRRRPGGPRVARARRGADRRARGGGAGGARAPRGRRRGLPAPAGARGGVPRRHGGRATAGACRPGGRPARGGARRAGLAPRRVDGGRGRRGRRGAGRRGRAGGPPRRDLRPRPRPGPRRRADHGSLRALPSPARRRPGGVRRRARHLGTDARRRGRGPRRRRAAARRRGLRAVAERGRPLGGALPVAPRGRRRRGAGRSPPRCADALRLERLPLLRGPHRGVGAGLPACLGAPGRAARPGLLGVPTDVAWVRLDEGQSAGGGGPGDGRPRPRPARPTTRTTCSTSASPPRCSSTPRIPGARDDRRARRAHAHAGHPARAVPRPRRSRAARAVGRPPRRRARRRARGVRARGGARQLAGRRRSDDAGHGGGRAGSPGSLRRARRALGRGRAARARLLPSVRARRAGPCGARSWGARDGAPRARGDDPAPAGQSRGLAGPPLADGSRRGPHPA